MPSANEQTIPTISVRTLVASGEMLDFLERLAVFAKEGQVFHWSCLMANDLNDETTAREELIELVRKAGGKVP